MSLQLPQLRWPFFWREIPEQVRSAILADHRAGSVYAEVTRNLDRVDFLLDDAGGLSVANNVWYEFSPEIESVVYEIKAHSKSPGAGNLTLQLAINGTVLDSVTITGGSSAVVRVTPAIQQLVNPDDKLSVNVSAASGTWRWVTFTAILEPRYMWEV